MFLIFTLGHLDVLPVGDLGVRKGMQILYKLRELPTSVKMEKIAKPWRVHASIASWYLWKVADEKKK
jgi:DNA-3-methyladenine glycosylase II